MRQKAIFFLFPSLLIIAGYLLYPYFSLLGFTEESQVIVVNDESFQPTTLTIKPNTKVVFKNTGKSPHWPASDFHPTHGIYPEFDSLEGIPPGEQWTFRFGKVGKWKFHDHLEPSLKGIIIVR